MYGIKRNSPTIIAVADEISTAPAATSFVSRAYGCISGDVRSISISMAVLKVSEVNTSPPV